MRLETRPTWLAVAVAGVTGYCLGNPDPVIGAFHEDGLPFILVGLVVIGVMILAAVETWQERRERKAREEAWTKMYGDRRQRKMRYDADEDQ